MPQRKSPRKHPVKAYTKDDGTKVKTHSKGRGVTNTAQQKNWFGIGDWVKFDVPTAIEEDTKKVVNISGVTMGRVAGWSYSKVYDYNGNVPMGTVNQIIVSVPAFGRGTWERHYEGDIEKDWNSRYKEAHIPHMSVLIPVTQVSKAPEFRTRGFK